MGEYRVEFARGPNKVVIVTAPTRESAVKLARMDRQNRGLVVGRVVSAKKVVGGFVG